MPGLTYEERKLAVDVLLAEYKELKAEIGVRAQRQTQAFNYFILIFGAVAGGIATILSRDSVLGVLLETNPNTPVHIAELLRVAGLALAGCGKTRHRRSR